MLDLFQIGILRPFEDGSYWVFIKTGLHLFVGMDFNEDLLVISARIGEPSFSDRKSKQPPPDLKNLCMEYNTLNRNHFSFSEDFLPPCCSLFSIPCFVL